MTSLTLDAQDTSEDSSSYLQSGHASSKSAAAFPVPATLIKSSEFHLGSPNHRWTKDSRCVSAAISVMIVPRAVEMARKDAPSQTQCRMVHAGECCLMQTPPALAARGIGRSPYHLNCSKQMTRFVVMPLKQTGPTLCLATLQPRISHASGVTNSIR